MSYHEHLQKIEKLAYQLWEKEGRPPGRALTNWLKAERLLSDDQFLKHELEVEEEEGGLIPKTLVSVLSLHVRIERKPSQQVSLTGQIPVSRLPPLMKPNLILSWTHDMGFEKLKPFLLSLRATGSQAHVHLFMAGCDEAVAGRSSRWA